MTDTPKQVARVTKELRALLTRLQWPAFQNSSPEDQNQILNGLLDASLVEDLRTTVDQLSHFLWCYVESVAANSDPEPDYETQSKRLGQITGMLRLLHRSAHPSEDPLAFVDRLVSSVDRHLETAGQEDLRSGTREACPAVDLLPGEVSYDCAPVVSGGSEFFS